MNNPPAFPRSGFSDGYRGNNPPAFPRSGFSDGYRGNNSQDGMTLRDYFAAKAMQAFIDSSETTGTAMHYARAAKWAYAQADAMLKAREQ